MISSAVENESSANNFLAWAASLLNNDIQNPPIVSSETSESRFYIGAHSITNFSQDPFLPSLLIPEPLHGHPKLDIIKSTPHTTTTSDVSSIEHLEIVATIPASTEPTKPKMKRKTSTEPTKPKMKRKTSTEPTKPKMMRKTSETNDVWNCELVNDITSFKTVIYSY